LSLYETLASKFPTKVIEPFKEPVLIVGVKEFKGEWREPLEKEGCKILVSDFLGRSCFLIRKPNNGASQSENNSQNEPCETGESENQHGKRKPWSREDEEKLRELFNQGKSYSELAEIFGRSRKALMQKLYDMNLKRESVKPKPTPKPNPKPTSNPDSQALNKTEIKELLEGSLMLLPSYPQAAKTLIEKVLDMVSS